MATLPPHLAQSGLPQRWAGLASFAILDTAFGDGAKFLATRRAWQDDAARPQRLFYLAHSVDGWPAPTLPADLRAAWPPAVPGWHRLTLDHGRVVLDVMIGPAASCISQIEARIDAFFCDTTIGAPQVLARLAAPGATLVAGAASEISDIQRQALAKAGFAWQAGAPEQLPTAVFNTRANIGRGASNDRAIERHATGRRAIERRAIERRAIVRRAIVIGAGLAGAAACERLAARGWHVLLVEQHAAPAQQASGNLAGIFMPTLSRDDNPAARLSRAAFLYALRRWRDLGGIGAAFAGASCGVLQLARDADHAAVQRQIAAHAGFPPDYARWLDSAAAGAMLGAPAPDGGWLFGQGGWAHPGGVCQAMLAACGGALERRFSTSALTLARSGEEWLVLDAGGQLIGQAPTVILANGTGATRMAQAAGLPLAAVRGQVTHLDQETAAACLPQPPLVVCREAYMTPAAGGVVCVGASYDADSDPALRADSQRDNLANIAAILRGGGGGGDSGSGGGGGGAAPAAQLPPLLAAAPLAGRTGFRCVAPDRLPLVGALPDAAANGRAERLRDVVRWPGLYGLLGYASRGLIWAPLAADLLVAQIEGEPLPLESGLAAALDPARFVLRQLRRSHAGAPP